MQVQHKKGKPKVVTEKQLLRDKHKGKKEDKLTPADLRELNIQMLKDYGYIDGSE